MELELEVDRALPFMVDGQALLKEFECTICQLDIKQAHITKCGHVFCKDCVLESINRHHRCPFCSTDLTENDLVKDYHFDNLKHIIIQAKNDFKNKVVNQVFNSNLQNESESPVFKIFKETLKDSVLLYESKFKEIKQIFEEKRRKINELYNHQSIDQIGQEHPDQLRAEIQQKYKQQIQQEDDQQNEIINHIQDSLLNYMKTAIPKPDILDTRVKLIIPKKNIRLESFTLKPYSYISDFKTNIISLFQKNNDPIDEKKLDTNQIFIVNLPLNSPEEITIKLSQAINQNEQSIANIIEQYGIKPYIQNLSSKQTFFDLKISQGSSIFVLGNMPSYSDQPPRCLTYQFQKDTVLDYYSCLTCNLNWICQSCALFCHKDHNSVVQLKNHTASWACCYCVTKNKCKAQNKNSK